MTAPCGFYMRAGATSASNPDLSYEQLPDLCYSCGLPEADHVRSERDGRRPPLRVLDLFAGLEGWSKPWRARGHDVFSTDIDKRFDVTLHADIFDLTPADLPWRPDVVLASPPCEGFTVMNIGKNWTKPTDDPPHQPKTDSARMALRLVERTRWLIDQLQPAYFVIENPRAKLRKLPVVADLERRTVTYCQYGLTSMKPTDLWGGFPPSLELAPPCKNGDDCHARAPRGSRTAGSIQGITGPNADALRAEVPAALSLAVCLACERDIDAAAEPAYTGRLF